MQVLSIYFFEFFARYFGLRFSFIICLRFPFWTCLIWRLRMFCVLGVSGKGFVSRRASLETR